MPKWIDTLLAGSLFRGNGRPRLAQIPDLVWQDTLKSYPFIAQRSADELSRLRQLSFEFLQHKEFHGAQGLVVTDEMAVSIAAQACLPLLNLAKHPLFWYDDFVGIVVHPDEVLARREMQDDTGVVHNYAELLTGEAMEGGPVTLSWKDVAQAGQSAAQGYNVVIHEFAHKIDMRNGTADGCPPLPAGFMGAASARAAHLAWSTTMQTEFERFCDQVSLAERFGAEPPWLDSYAATALDEFFAVTCEAYFVNTQQFNLEFPALVLMYDAFFNASPQPGT